MAVPTQERAQHLILVRSYNNYFSFLSRCIQYYYYISIKRDKKSP